MCSSRLEAPSRGAVWIWSTELRRRALPVHDHRSRPSAAAQCRHPSQAEPTSLRWDQPSVTAMLRPYQPVWITRRRRRSTSRNGRPVDLCPMRTTSFLTQKSWRIIPRRHCCWPCLYVSLTAFSVIIILLLLCSDVVLESWSWSWAASGTHFCGLGLGLETCLGLARVWSLSWPWSCTMALFTCDWSKFWRSK